MKAYWWRGQNYVNLGDELAKIVPERLFNVELNHSSIASANLLSVGSVLGWVWENEITRVNSASLHVVGSGFMSFDTRPFPLEHLKIHSVRGYLSKNRLGQLDNWKVRIGDPGILASRVFTGKPSGKKYEIGVILHHKHSENDDIKSKFSHLPVHFIDIRTNDLDALMFEMLHCDLVLSQSLHGLIIADSLGIPNAWLFMGYLHSGADFKFFDYFSTVDRSFRKRIRGVPKSIEEILPQVFCSDQEVIFRLQNQVIDAYEEAFSEIGSNN